MSSGVVAAVDVIGAVVVHVVIAEIFERGNGCAGKAQAMPADAAVLAVADAPVALHQRVGVV
jgi:hypothetical protein